TGRSPMTSFAGILLASIRLDSIRSCRMRHAGCWRSILTRRHGSKTPPRFSLPATNSTCQRHWNAHDQETVATCGYSLSEQSLPQPRENLAVQSSPEPWNLATSLGWIHMTDYSPT